MSERDNNTVRMDWCVSMRRRGDAKGDDGVKKLPRCSGIRQHGAAKCGMPGHIACAAEVLWDPTTSSDNTVDGKKRKGGRRCVATGMVEDCSG